MTAATKLAAITKIFTKHAPEPDKDLTREQDERINLEVLAYLVRNSTPEKAIGRGA